MNLERAALAALAKREENDFLRALRDLLAPPDGESKPFVSDALNLIGDRLIVLGGTTRPEALRIPENHDIRIEHLAQIMDGCVMVKLPMLKVWASELRTLKLSLPSPLARRPIKIPPEDGGWET